MKFAINLVYVMCLFSSSFLARAARTVNIKSNDLQNVGANESQTLCPPPHFDTQGALEGGFDLDWYTSSKWYIQQQMPISYLPEEYNYCVTAEYKVLKKKTFVFRYDIEVTNRAQNAEGKQLGPLNTICAKIVDKDAGKLNVAPCFLPKFAAGPYWIIAFSKVEGWALVSGGPPTEEGSDGCKTGTGTNNSGLWIFTRQQQPGEEIISKVRDLAKAKGFDTSVLKSVSHSNCAP